eukprot:6808192-Alexandrium_andersonii.AAC.1
MLSLPPRLESLIRLANSTIGFATDLGTEVGVADFQAPTVRSSMAPWLFPERSGRSVLPSGGLGEVSDTA